MTPNKKHEGSVWQSFAIVLMGLIVAAIFWVAVDLFIDRKFDTSVVASPGKIFAMEVAIFCLILGPFVGYEIHRLGRAITNHGSPKPPRLETAIAVLIAFAGSLSIYLAFVWCSSKIGHLQP